jgi:hypothetical protein
MGQEPPSIHHLIAGYPFKVWFISIIITPLLFIVWEAIKDNNYSLFSPIGILVYFFMLAGLVAFSVPSMVIYIILFRPLIKSSFHRIFIKLTPAFLAIVCIWLTALAPVSTDHSLSDLVFNISYNTLTIHSSVILLLSCIFPLIEENK